MKSLHEVILYQLLDECTLLTRIVSCNVAQSPGSSLLHPGVKLLQAQNQSVHPPAGHHSLRQLWGVFGYCTQNKCCCLLIEPLHTNTQTPASVFKMICTLQLNCHLT